MNRDAVPVRSAGSLISLVELCLIGRVVLTNPLLYLLPHRNGASNKYMDGKNPIVKPDRFVPVRIKNYIS